MSEAAAPTSAPETPAAPDAPTGNRWTVPLLLMAATFASTFYVGAQMVLEREPVSFRDWLSGWVFSVPLMSILLAHEFGHFLAGKRHGVDVSPPYFIPIPRPPFGTMGAIIRIRGQIQSRDALFDVGAAGPLAGLVVALPVLALGISQSEVSPLPEQGIYLAEGHSLLYAALLYALKGPIPEGQDIFLSPTALAGWAGLLVTMINLLPFGQLDGGHVTYALLGERQNRVSRVVLFALPFLAAAVSLAHMDLFAGLHWLVWAFVLFVLSRFSGVDHPPTRPGPLSPRRRILGWFTMSFFVLLFMPSWLRVVEAGG